MSELIFLVEEALDGGFIAKALGESIFTEGEDMKDLRRNIRESVACHFDIGKGPSMLRLHFVKDEYL